MILCVNIYSFRYLHYIYIYFSGNSYSMFEALQSVQPGGAIQSGGLFGDRSRSVTFHRLFPWPHFDRRHHLAKMPSWRAHLIGYLHLSAPICTYLHLSAPMLFVEASPLEHSRYIWTFRELQFASRGPKESQKIVVSRTAWR